MDILLSVLAVLFAVVGSIGCVIPALPGGFLTFAGYLCFYFCSYVDIPVMWPIIFGVLTVVAALLDFIVPSYMTKLFGGTKAGSLGSFSHVARTAVFSVVIGILLSVGIKLFS